MSAESDPKRIWIRPGNVLGLIAVVLAMSGSAVAASKITSQQIKDGTITSKDIKDDTITVRDVSQSLLDSVSGEQGPAGPQGPAGAPGPAGPSAVSKLTPVTVDFSVPGGSGTVTPSSIKIITATCPPGQRVVSGGYFMSLGFAFSDKTYDGASWSVGVDNYESYIPSNGQVTALCAASGVAVATSAGRAARDARIAQDVKRVRDLRLGGTR